VRLASSTSSTPQVYAPHDPPPWRASPIGFFTFRGVAAGRTLISARFFFIVCGRPKLVARRQCWRRFERRSNGRNLSVAAPDDLHKIAQRIMSHRRIADVDTQITSFRLHCCFAPITTVTMACRYIVALHQITMSNRVTEVQSKLAMGIIDFIDDLLSTWDVDENGLSDFTGAFWERSSPVKNGAETQLLHRDGASR